MMLGVIMLDTRFVRLPGDIGQPASHAGPVLFETVPRATAALVVGGIASLTDPVAREAAVGPFVAAGARLVARGATAITTSCGFLVTYQAELQAALPVPVMTSALCLLPEIAVGRRVGVLTFDAASLGAMHLRAAGFAGECAVAGLAQGCGFRREVLEDAATVDVAGREADVLEAAGRLPGDVEVVLLECTNFPPHRAAVFGLLGVPVFDVWDAVRRLDDLSRRHG
jgi:hypothetical protein